MILNSAVHRERMPPTVRNSAASLAKRIPQRHTERLERSGDRLTLVWATTQGDRALPRPVDLTEQIVGNQALQTAAARSAGWMLHKRVQ